MPLAEYHALQRTFEGRAIDLVELSGFVEELRQVKDESEITAMRKAQSITDAAFANIIAFMKPGMTEREVQLQLDRYMYEGRLKGWRLAPLWRRALMPHLLMRFLVKRNWHLAMLW